MAKSTISTDDLIRIVEALAASLRETPGQFVSMHINEVIGFQAGGGAPGGGVGYLNMGQMVASPTFTASADSASNDQPRVASELEAFAALLQAQPDVGLVRDRWNAIKANLPAVLTTAVGEMLALSVFHIPH
jgi:hypothetical protein